MEMQDTKSGLKGSDQKLNVTTIPHVISGETETHKQVDTQFHKHEKVSYLIKPTYYYPNMPTIFARQSFFPFVTQWKLKY